VTRLAILSDIHGNSIALEAVLSDLAPFRVDQIVVAGDIVNWGPSSAQVMERITREGWPVVRGNNEFYVLDYNTPRAPVEWSDSARYTLLPWLNHQLNGRWRNVIAGLPDTLSLHFPDAPPLRVVHGSPRDNKELIFPATPESEIEAMFANVVETTIVAGTLMSSWINLSQAGTSSILVRSECRLMGYSPRATYCSMGMRTDGARRCDVCPSITRRCSPSSSGCGLSMSAE
jgi:hypothetical protein